MVSTEGNTLTGLINPLRSPIHPDRTVHRLFCIAMLALASASAVLAQGEPQRPEPAPAAKVANPAPADPPAAPSTPAMLRLQFPNSDVVDGIVPRQLGHDQHSGPAEIVQPAGDPERRHHSAVSRCD